MSTQPEIDLTMRSLLAVHLVELSERDAQIKRLNDSVDWLVSQVRSEEARYERANADFARLRDAEKVKTEKIAKLESVIESLKIELADVRAQFTKAREAGDYTEAVTRQVIETDAALEALPPVSVVLDFENDAFQKTGNGYWSKDGDDGDVPVLPVEVLWTPPWKVDE